MKAKKQSRVQSWPRWIASTVAGLLVSAFAAIAAIFGFGATLVEAATIAGPVLLVMVVVGSISEFFGGLLAGMLEGLSMISVVVLAPLAFLEGCG